MQLTLLLVGAFAAIVVLAPTGYGSRLLTIFMPGLDSSGSADSRRGELFRSIYVALRHPLLGIGMGNYQPNMSYRGLVTHNSYTQVAAEMGMTACVLYTMFIVSPLRKLSTIVRETLAVGTDFDLLLFRFGSASLAAGVYGFQLLLVRSVRLECLLPDRIRRLLSPDL